MFDSRYEAQVRLLLRCLPEVGRQECFALKGGTAINLFLRDLPRISVDIDLTYLPLKPRDAALAEISNALLAIGKDVERRVAGSTVQLARSQGYVIKLVVTTGDAEVKIEPNLVLRGTVYPTCDRELTPMVQAHFGIYARMAVLSEADLYGGKLCAALDRQHPRDLFDTKLLLDSGGITPEIRRAFVVYVASHPRPMAEILSPNLLDIEALYDGQFRGMTRIDVPLPELLAVRQRLLEELIPSLDADERAFLISVKTGELDWEVLDLDHLSQLPAIQWKLINVRKMAPDKHAEALRRLQSVLGWGI